MPTTTGTGSKIRAGFWVVALLAACAGDRPLVERFQQGAWQPERFQVTSLSGHRDGTDVFFSLVLHGEAGQRLLVEGTVEVDPQARLVSGRWVEESGSRSRSGVVSAPAIDFFGGQGGRPGVGGRFTLSVAVAGPPVYRLNLPTTLLESGKAPGARLP